MNVELFESTKLSAYFLWESTKHENALQLWYCAEEIACFFERMNILQADDILEIRKRGKYDISYINFIRHISFRIFVYTNEEFSVTNWYLAESLLENGEWCLAVTKMSNIYHSLKNNASLVAEVRSDSVKSYYQIN